MTKTAPPLQSARTFDCGPVRVEVAHTTVTDTSKVGGRTADDPWRDRFEIRLTDRGLPPGAEVDYLSPQPSPFFFSFFRKREDGSLVDLTEPQIDPCHSGDPWAVKKRFARPGETLTDTISFFVLSMIVPIDEIVPGEYVVRLRSYDMITVGGTAYPSEPVEMPITIRSVRNP